MKQAKYFTTDGLLHSGIKHTWTPKPVQSPRVPFFFYMGFAYTAPAHPAITVQDLCKDLDKQGGPVVWWVTDEGGLTYARKPTQPGTLVLCEDSHECPRCGGDVSWHTNGGKCADV